MEFKLGGARKHISAFLTWELMFLRLVFFKILFEVEYGAALITRMMRIEMILPASSCGKNLFAFLAFDIVEWGVLVLVSCIVAPKYLVTVPAFERVPRSVVLNKVKLIREVPDAEIAVEIVI